MATFTCRAAPVNKGFGYARRRARGHKDGKSAVVNRRMGAEIMVPDAVHAFAGTGNGWARDTRFARVR